MDTVFKPDFEFVNAANMELVILPDEVSAIEVESEVFLT